MTALIGIRDEDGLIEYAHVGTIEARPPTFTYLDQLRGWSNAPTALRLLCGFGSVLTVRRTAIELPGVNLKEQFFAARITDTVDEYLAAAADLRVEMAALCEEGQWRCWQPLSEDELSGAERAAQELSAVHDCFVRGAAEMEASPGASPQQMRSLRSAARRRAKEAGQRIKPDGADPRYRNALADVLKPYSELIGETRSRTPVMGVRRNAHSALERLAWISIEAARVRTTALACRTFRDGESLAESALRALNERIEAARNAAEARAVWPWPPPRPANENGGNE